MIDYVLHCADSDVETTRTVYWIALGRTFITFKLETSGDFVLVVSMG